LRDSRLAAQRAPATTEGQRARLLGIAERVSEPALLEPLLRSLDERGERPAMHDVDALLESLGARALGALQAWSAASRHRDLRVRYTAAADRLVDEHPEALITLVGDDRDDTALDAMRRLGALELEEAVPALVKQFARPEEPRRAAALAALAAIGTPRAMSAVERALHDDSVTLRTTALRTLMAQRHAAVRHWVTDKVKSRDVREMDNGERRALFELFGTLCGDDEVPWLTGQLVGPQGFFKRKSDPETRACSAAALGRIGSAAARAALRDATSIQDPLIRRAVQRALAGTGDA
jgi:HEAT repeat protein